jgi:hypothetical protein
MSRATYMRQTTFPTAFDETVQKKNTLRYLTMDIGRNLQKKKKIWTNVWKVMDWTQLPSI